MLRKYIVVHHHLQYLKCSTKLDVVEWNGIVSVFRAFVSVYAPLVLQLPGNNLFVSIWSCVFDEYGTHRVHGIVLAMVLMLCRSPRCLTFFPIMLKAYSWPSFVSHSSVTQIETLGHTSQRKERRNAMYTFFSP